MFRLKVAGHVVERDKTVTKGLKVVGDSRMVAKLRPAVLTRTIQIVARMTEMSTDHRLTATGGGDDNRNRPQLLRCLRQTFGRVSSSIFSHPLGNSTKICYNTFNAPVSVTDANGIVTKYAYNDAGLVTRMERLDGSETLTFRAFMCHADGQLAYCGNGVARKVDIVGCWGANVHHDINQTYLENQEIDRHAYKWGKFSLDVLGKMDSGSDWTDSIWAGNQNDDKAYMHAMCSAWEGTAGARLRWETYLNELVVKARALSDLARQMYSTGDYEIALYTENLAIEYLGRIFHTYDDSFAPPHSGFQRFSDQNLFDHIAQESWDVYVTGEYRVELPHINPIPGNEAVTIITYRTGGFRNYIYQQIRDAYMQTVLYVLRQPE